MNKHSEKRVGIVLPHGQESSQLLLKGATEFTANHPNIHLEMYEYERGRTPHWLRKLPDCNGWMTWTNAGDEWVQRLLETNRPIVNTGGGWPLNRVAIVAFGSGDIARLAVEHLVKPGLKCLGFVGCDVEHDPYQRKLLDLFLKTCSTLERGPRVVTLDLKREQGVGLYPPRLTPRDRKDIGSFLGQLELPAALWCMSDSIAMGVIEMAREWKLSVPGQVAVLGLGNHRGARLCKPTLSSISQPAEIIGYEAMRVLVGLMAGQALPDHPIVITTPPVEARESTSNPELVRTPLQRAYEYLVAHACQGVKVQDLLRLARMSHPTFRERFVAKYRRTPGAEIRRIRLERAQYYLRTTGYSMTRIAELCGFESPTEFSHFFRRGCGQPPTRYRRKHRQQ